MVGSSSRSFLCLWITITPSFFKIFVFIIFNNVSRFSPRPLKYFTHTQVYQHHLGNSDNDDAIAVYSFSLNPKENQPSGTCNFSRLHTVNLNFDNITTDDSQLLVFATNYNVLVISSGMAGLKYAN